MQPGVLNCRAVDAHVAAVLLNCVSQAYADMMLGVQSTSGAKPTAAQQPATNKPASNKSAPFTSTHASTQVAQLR